MAACLGTDSVHNDLVPHIKRVHHKQIDDGLIHSFHRVAEHEGKGEHNGAEHHPHLLKVHLCTAVDSSRHKTHSYSKELGVEKGLNAAYHGVA